MRVQLDPLVLQGHELQGPVGAFSCAPTRSSIIETLQRLSCYSANGDQCASLPQLRMKCCLALLLGYLHDAGRIC